MGKGRENEGDAILYDMVKGSLREKGAINQRSEWRESISAGIWERVFQAQGTAGANGQTREWS